MIESGILVAIIMGLTEIAKRTGQLPSRWAGVFAVVLGIIISMFAGGEMFANAVQGIIAGLISSGAYSASKAALNR